MRLEIWRNKCRKLRKASAIVKVSCKQTRFHITRISSVMIVVFSKIVPMQKLYLFSNVKFHIKSLYLLRHPSKLWFQNLDFLNHCKIAKTGIPMYLDTMGLSTFSRIPSPEQSLMESRWNDSTVFALRQPLFVTGTLSELPAIRLDA